MNASSVAARMMASVADVCPIVSVSIGTVGDSGSVRLIFDPASTAQQQSAAQAIVVAFDWSDAAQTAWQNSQDRAAAKAVFANNTDATAKILRAATLALLDQINVIRAALPTPLPAITVAQARNAIQNKLDSGSVD